MKKKKIFRITLMIYLIAVVGFVSYFSIFFYRDYQDRQRLENLADQMQAARLRAAADPIVSESEESQSSPATVSTLKTPKEILVQYQDLYLQNQDLYGWINIPDTQLNYPVMYTPLAGDYYLYRDFAKDNSRHGLPFIDYHASVEPRSTNLLIHGHNMKDGSMFATLAKYQSRSFYLNHPNVQFDTIYETGDYEIFAAFLTQIYPDDVEKFRYYQFVQADSKEAFDAYVNQALGLSLYDTGIRPEFGDQLLTLSTCSYQVNDGRMVVVARRIQSSEFGATR